MLYQVLGINRRRQWSYQDKTGVNQVFYVRRMDKLKGDSCEGYACEILKAPKDFDSSGLFVGKVYDFYFNRYGSLEGFTLSEETK